MDIYGSFVCKYGYSMLLSNSAYYMLIVNELITIMEPSEEVYEYIIEWFHPLCSFSFV